MAVDQAQEQQACKRWTAARKKEAVVRLLQGASIDALSRELGVPIGQLEKWKETVLNRMEASLKENKDHPLHSELEEAKKRIGALCMENELLKVRCKKQGVFYGGRR